MAMRQPGSALRLGGFAQASEAFFGDLTLMEPGLLQIYGELLPRIDEAIGTRGAAPSAAR